MLLGLFFWAFMNAYAEEPNHFMEIIENDGIVIYVDIEKDNKIELTHLIAANARLHKEVINEGYAMKEGIGYEKRKIRIYDKTNIAYFDSCDYLKNPIPCSIENKNWLIKTHIYIEDLHASLIVNLHDETGNIIGTSSIPVHGWIELLPQWKKTTVVSSGMMGQTKQTILEQWPHKQKKHPPYIRSKDVSQALIGLFLSFDK